MVELAVLERLCTGNRTEGSNPSSSAIRLVALAFGEPIGEHVVII